VDTGVGDVYADTEKTRWLILIYQLPREPSRHRVAVWRKLKTLGALYLQNGAAALPEDSTTREQLEWLQLRVREAGGEATLWQALPNTVAEGKSLVEEFRASREKAYGELIEAAGRLKREAALGSNKALLLEELGTLEREFRAERRRDYFRSPLRNEAAATLRVVRQTLKEGGVEAERSGKVGEG
jgi:DNA-binding transcriptional regulator PaaX